MDAISTALSGLNAAQTRINVSASNIANADTPNYKAQQVVQTPSDGGGVQTQVVDKNPPTVTASDGNGGTEQAPNTSPDQELVNAQIAAYDYKANLRVIKTEDDLQQSLLDVTA